jgi:hypothetical protein
MITFNEFELEDMLRKIRLVKNANKKHFDKDVRICPLCYETFIDGNEWGYCQCDNDE